VTLVVSYMLHVAAFVHLSVFGVNVGCSMFAHWPYNTQSTFNYYGCTHRSNLRSMWVRRRNLTAFPRTT